VVRFDTDNLDSMVRLFEQEGFTVLEMNFQGKPVVNTNNARRD